MLLISSISMYPMLRHRKDMVVVEKLNRPLKKYDVPVLDLYKASNEYSDRIRENNPSAKTVITGTDGIHPNANGGFLFGYLFARAQETNEYIAKVEIDALTDEIDATNASVTDLDVSANSVSYTYLPKSLPIYNDSRYNYVKNHGVDILNHMNRKNWC